MKGIAGLKNIVAITNEAFKCNQKKYRIKFVLEGNTKRKVI
jgi:hypothetical protein